MKTGLSVNSKISALMGRRIAHKTTSLPPKRASYIDLPSFDQLSSNELFSYLHMAAVEKGEFEDVIIKANSVKIRTKDDKSSKSLLQKFKFTQVYDKTMAITDIIAKHYLPQIIQFMTGINSILVCIDQSEGFKEYIQVCIKYILNTTEKLKPESRREFEIIQNGEKSVLTSQTVISSNICSLISTKMPHSTLILLRLSTEKDMVEFADIIKQFREKSQKILARNTLYEPICRLMKQNVHLSYTFSTPKINLKALSLFSENTKANIEDTNDKIGAEELEIEYEPNAFKSEHYNDPIIDKADESIAEARNTFEKSYLILEKEFTIYKNEHDNVYAALSQLNKNEKLINEKKQELESIQQRISEVEKDLENIKIQIEQNTEKEQRMTKEINEKEENSAILRDENSQLRENVKIIIRTTKMLKEKHQTLINEMKNDLQEKREMHQKEIEMIQQKADETLEKAKEEWKQRRFTKKTVLDIDENTNPNIQND